MLHNEMSAQIIGLGRIVGELSASPERQLQVQLSPHLQPTYVPGLSAPLFPVRGEVEYEQPLYTIPIDQEFSQRTRIVEQLEWMDKARQSVSSNRTSRQGLIIRTRTHISPTCRGNY